MLLAKREKIAISFGNSKISYKELHSGIEHFSSQYTIKEGDRVVIFSENRPGWAYSFYSIWHKKGLAVTIDFMLPADEVSYILADCGASTVFVSKGTHELMKQAISLKNLELNLIAIDDFEEGFATTDTWINITPDINNTAVIIYTSGTTGAPKGVMLSFNNLLVNLKAVCIDIPILTEEQTILVLLPLHHILPLLGTLIAPLYMGGTMAISPSMASDDIIATLKRDNVTVLIGVPRLFSAIRKGIMDKVNNKKIAKALFKVAEKLKSRAFSRFIFKEVHNKFGGKLRYMVCGGAALEPTIASDFYTLGFDILEGYGMTETAPMISFTRPGYMKLGSPGQIVPFGEVKIIEGEIAVKGPSVMNGYWGKPNETNETIKDGWLMTGDLGYIDNNQYLFITGRKKELIILSNGKNIDPVEVEQKISQQSELILEVAVLQADDQLHAVIVPNSTIVEQKGITDLQSYFRNTVLHQYNRSTPPYRKILNFTISQSELPRTRLGKLKRFQLKELISKPNTKNDIWNAETEPQSAEFNMLANFIKQEKNIKISPSDHIEFDLGLDSLDKVSLQVFIKNTFGLEMPPEVLVQYENIGQLTIYIANNRKKMSDQKVNWTEIVREKSDFLIHRTWITTHIFTRVINWFFNLYFRYRGKGLENLPDGPCIIAPNHQSYFDGLLVTGLLKHKQIEKTYFYVKENHVKGQLLKYMAKRNNIILMDLNKDLKHSIQKMAEVLRRKKYMVIFPEGTRSKTGKIGDFKKTFAILSRELNIPIVPVSIKGAYDALPTGKIFPKPFKRICVEYLSPIYPENRSYEEIVELVKQQILSHQQTSCQ